MSKPCHELALSALLVLASVPAFAAEPRDPHIDAMYSAINSKEPAQAVAEADLVIAGFERRFNKPGTLYLCGNTPEETLMNMALAARQGKSAVGVPPAWCSAHFIKGFAAVDLNQPAEAERELRIATEMAPHNAHYLNEYAELFKTRREWQRAYALFARAADVAPVYPSDGRPPVHARALRGMGFTRIELGDLDGAERLFKRSLELQPGNLTALAELKYIAQERVKKQGQVR